MKTGALRQGVAASAVLALSVALAAPIGAQARVPAVEVFTTTEAHDPIRYEGAFIIAEAWRELGRDITAPPPKFRTLRDRFCSEQGFDATIPGWSGRVDRLDPQFFLGTLDSRQAGLGANNPGGYDTPDYDALFDAQSRAVGIGTRRDILHEMQDLSMGDVPVVMPLHRDAVVACNRAAFPNMNAMAGEGPYSDWVPMAAEPVGDRSTLRIGGPQEPDNVTPLASTGLWGWKWLRLCFDRLVRLPPDVEPVPSMATAVDPVDETTIEVTLREGMTFRDGEPVTAADVAFTVDDPMNSDYSHFNADLAPIDPVEATGDLSVRFTLTEPSAPFATITLSQIPILPQHIREGIETPETLAPDQIPTVGSGPFVCDRDDRGEFMSLTTHAEHFHAGGIAVDGVGFDMEAVRAELEAAGYSRDSDGRLPR